MSAKPNGGKFFTIRNTTIGSTSFVFVRSSGEEAIILMIITGHGNMTVEACARVMRVENVLNQDLLCSARFRNIPARSPYICSLNLGRRGNEKANIRKNKLCSPAALSTR